MSKKVFLAIGHGGSDPGAVGNGLKESELNLKQGKVVERELKRHDVEVKMSRYKEENDDLNEEVRECNAYNPDLTVALHTNSGGGLGFEVLHSVYTTGTSYKLAKNINDVIVAAKYKSRGCKSRWNSTNTADYYGYIRNTNAPSVITEMAFIDNKADISNFDEDHEIEAYSICIAKGILKTLGIAWKEEPKPAPAPSKPSEDKKKTTFYRVVVDGKVIGSYADFDNAKAEADKAMKDKKSKIELIKVEA